MGNMLPAPKSVRVLNTEGRLMTFSACQVVTAADVLHSHPHHCLTETGQERNLSRGVVLREDEVLKPGKTYVILPLPRLFSMASRRPPSRPSIAYNCWFCNASGGFPPSDMLTDDTNDAQWDRMDDAGPPASLVAMEKSLGEIKSSPAKTTRSPSPQSIDLQNLLKSAGIEWKEITDLSTTWRPDLESIKEESMKLLPPRQSLAELIESEMFMKLLRRRSEEREDRGTDTSIEIDELGFDPN
ncbi:unnamed protein product [Calypogeia fissa]